MGKWAGSEGDALGIWGESEGRIRSGYDGISFYTCIKF